MPASSSKFSLTLIVGALLAITVIVGTLLHHQKDVSRTALRTQGLGLTDLLAEVPLDQLITQGSAHSALRIATNGIQRSELAYAAVVDPEGLVLSQVSSTGIGVPVSPISSQPALWRGQRQVQLPMSATSAWEFHAPILKDGQLAAFIRLGYFDRGWHIGMTEVSIFATAALPVFLLVPLVQFLMRRELKPLTNVSVQMSKVIDSEPWGELEHRELREFFSGFRRFISRVDERIDLLETQKNTLRASGTVLEYRQNRMLGILEALPYGLILLDRNGTATLANRHAAYTLNVKEEDFIGATLEDWCRVQQFRSYIESRFAQPTANGHSSPEFSVDHAPEQVLRATAAAMDGKEDNGLVVVLMDVTEHALAQRSRADFVAHVSHELKSPLNTLGMYSEALLGSTGDDRDFQIEAANAIQDEVSRLGGLISNLLNITKIELGSMGIERTRVRLNDFLQDIFENMSRLGREQNIDCEFDVTNELSAISIDKDMMRIALNNLFSNAIKYNQPGGKVVLSADETDDAITINITDTGIGIEEHDQDRVFDKFYRSESANVRERTGHGLGLTLVKDIVNLHHGQLNMQSVAGEGTTMTIRFSKTVGLLATA